VGGVSGRGEWVVVGRGGKHFSKKLDFWWVKSKNQSIWGVKREKSIICLFVCLFGTHACHGTLLEEFRMASDKLKSSEDGPSQGGESGTRRLLISDTSEALR